MTQVEHARGLARARKWADLAALSETIDPDEVARSPELAYLLADALRRTGEMAAAGPLADSAAKGARTAANENLTLRTINLLGMIAFETGETGQAEARFNELLDEATRQRNDEFAARAANNLGVLANVRGEIEIAVTSYERALASYHRTGYARGLAQTYYNLGISYRDLGFPDDADAHYGRSIQFADDSGSEDVVALAETERASLRARAGDGHLAESIASRALARLERMEDPAGAANAVRVLAAAARSRGASSLALERLDEALATVDRHPDALLRGEIQRDRGDLLASLAMSDAAVIAYNDSIAAFQRLGALREVAATRASLAAIAPPEN